MALTEAHKMHRLAWAKRMVVTPQEEWKKIIISDEKKVQSRRAGWASELLARSAGDKRRQFGDGLGRL
ncbi:hypothetical protein ON010_g6968 [Phytophthora cinnamomi]|nr:hypothetical protein ON010_g6968 [Phytophthora cinnamomi]